MGSAPVPAGRGRGLKGAQGRHRDEAGWRDRHAGEIWYRRGRSARFLTAQGSKVEFVSGHRFVPAGWDYAILFNAALLPSTVLASEACRRSGVPYVLFPVFWDLKLRHTR